MCNPYSCTFNVFVYHEKKSCSLDLILNLIMCHFYCDKSISDFVVVKLDVDTASVEVPLAFQLLNDTSVHSVVDQFYFEHHVHAFPISENWRTSMRGSIKDTFELFTSLRKSGIPSHFWP